MELQSDVDREVGGFQADERGALAAGQTQSDGAGGAAGEREAVGGDFHLAQLLELVGRHAALVGVVNEATQVLGIAQKVIDGLGITVGLDGAALKF